jgi:hypothetical protein
MPALAKVTPAQRQEIRRRRAADETLVSIGRLVGLPHQTVSRIDRQERALQAEREAKAAVVQEAERALLLLWDGWTVSFDPHASGPLYPNQDCRIDYWARRQSTHVDRLNLNDVYLFHRLLHGEERAMEHGRQLFLYPPNTETAPAGSRSASR